MEAVLLAQIRPRKPLGSYGMEAILFAQIRTREALKLAAAASQYFMVTFVSFSVGRTEYDV